MARLINRTAKRIETGIRQVIVVALGKVEAAMHCASAVFSRPATGRTAGYLSQVTRWMQPVVVPAVRLERLAKCLPLSAAPRCWHAASNRLPALSVG